MLRVTAEGEDRHEVEREVDEAITEFDEYFKDIQGSGGSLTPYERAAIKTFCAFKLGLGPNNPAAKGQEDGTTSSG